MALQAMTPIALIVIVGAVALAIVVGVVLFVVMGRKE